MSSMVLRDSTFMQVGESFREGDPLITVFGASDDLVSRAADRVANAMELGKGAIDAAFSPLITHALDKSGLHDYDEWTGRRV